MTSMRVIETTAYVGSDGMLRLEVPLEQRSQDVRIALVVESPPLLMLKPGPIDDRWGSMRNRVAGTSIRLPAPGVTNGGPVEPVVLPGLSASETLINDRR